jgi:hypothetical protein
MVARAFMARSGAEVMQESRPSEAAAGGGASRKGKGTVRALAPRSECQASAPEAARISASIHDVRGQPVMLDRDLAVLYGVSTRAINQAVRRNPLRFPRDFTFMLGKKEVRHLMSQSVISSSWGGVRKPTRAFSEHGIAMLSSVLRSDRAALVNVAIMRVFVELRRALWDREEISRRVAALEGRFDRTDARIAEVFEAIRQMLEPPEAEPRERIGFRR